MNDGESADKVNDFGRREEAADAEHMVWNVLGTERGSEAIHVAAAPEQDGGCGWFRGGGIRIGVVVIPCLRCEGTGEPQGDSARFFIDVFVVVGVNGTCGSPGSCSERLHTHGRASAERCHDDVRRVEHGGCITPAC